MKVIIAGSRDLSPSLKEIDAAIVAANFTPTEIVCGMARGVDLAGLAWATARNVPVARFPADWDVHGRAAGHIRNREMAAYADALLAFWDGVSPGTKGMIDAAKARGLQLALAKRE